MSIQPRVQAGVRTGGQFTNQRRGEPAPLDGDSCYDCGGEVVADGDDRFHIGRDGSPVDLDHKPVLESDLIELPPPRPVPVFDAGEQDITEAGAIDFLDDRADRAENDATLAVLRAKLTEDPADLANAKLAQAHAATVRNEADESRVRNALTGEPAPAQAPKVDYQIQSPGLEYATDGTDVIVTTSDDGHTRMTRGKVTFELPSGQTPVNGYSHSATHGDRYVKGAYRSVVDIAKDIRADVKAAKETGWLPSNLTYRVQTRHGSTVDVDIEGLSDADRTDPDKVADAARGWNQRNTNRDEITELRHRVQSLIDRHKKFDSDSMTDYFGDNFYGSANVQTDDEARFWAKDRARKAARRAELAAKKAGVSR
ncbi:hypothetical protein [Nostocoides vanveenii]|uniref:Uncharacterized protein n=1 Tax=Nostocoides vanveenii TaxID=330835 RepID=A0ABP4XAF2_9MICO